MSEELKPANQHPDFGKVCSHGSLKRQCYTCELEVEIDRLKEQNEKMRKALIEVKLHECTCHTGCGPCFNYFYLIAEDILKELGEK